MAGLQDIAPMVEKRCVTNAVLAPMRPDAAAASQPAWPPPMTMTSNDLEDAVMDRTSIAEWQKPKAVSRALGQPVSRETSGMGNQRATFHVKQSVNRLNEGILLSDTEFPEDDVQDVLDVDPAEQATERICGRPELFGG